VEHFAAHVSAGISKGEKENTDELMVGAVRFEPTTFRTSFTKRPCQEKQYLANTSNGKNSPPQPSIIIGRQSFCRYNGKIDYT
jgi:hypothetical protein